MKIKDINVSGKNNIGLVVWKNFITCHDHPRDLPVVGKPRKSTGTIIYGARMPTLSAVSHVTVLVGTRVGCKTAPPPPPLSGTDPTQSAGSVLAGISISRPTATTRSCAYSTSSLD